MTGIEKYIRSGIWLSGNPIDGYTVFTEPTKMFRISSLSELTPECFEKFIHEKLNKTDCEEKFANNFIFYN